VVQLHVRLLAPADRVQDILTALRAVMLPARRDRACTFAQISLAPDDRRRVCYVEEWADEAELRRQFRSERFVRLLEVLESAVEPPVVEFKIFSRTYGLDYITGDHIDSGGADAMRGAAQGGAATPGAEPESER
jgi:quinol monooxygenase YgiN